MARADAESRVWLAREKPLPAAAMIPCQASLNQFCITLWPAGSVQTDSGWYWSPQKGSVACLAPIRILSTPSSLDSSVQARGTMSGQLVKGCHFLAGHSSAGT